MAKKKACGDVLLREHEVMENLLDTLEWKKLSVTSTLKVKADLTQQKK